MLSIRVEYSSTQRLDAEVLEKFYDDLVPDLPRVPYVDEASARATVEAIQALGPPLPKVGPKTLYDNRLLKSLEAKGSPTQ